MAPHTIPEVDAYWQRERVPFVGVADPDRRVFRRYGVESGIWSLGQRPGLFVLDRDGVLRFSHIGAQQWDIPSEDQVLAAIARLARQRGAGV